MTTTVLHTMVIGVMLFMVFAYVYPETPIKEVGLVIFFLSYILSFATKKLLTRNSILVARNALQKLVRRYRGES